MSEVNENTRFLTIRALKKISFFFFLFSSCVAITRFFNSSSFPPSSSSSPQSSLSLEQLKSTFKHTRRLHVPKTKPDLGTSRMRPRSLIIGGSPAAPGRYPYYTAVLFFESSTPGAQFCGGVKIMDGIVLTAANCLRPLSGSPFYDSITVAMGNDMDFTSSSTLLADPNVVSESVQNVYWSASYAESSMSSQPFADFALLELANPITTFANAALNSDEAIPADGTTMKAIGFGATESATRSAKLLEVDIDAQPASVCEEFVDEYSNDVMLCAQTDGQGTCFADEGGPLIITGATPDDDVVVGLSSFGVVGGFLGVRSCAGIDPTAPEVEARVSWFFPATTAQPITCDPTPNAGERTSLDCFNNPDSGNFFGALIGFVGNLLTVILREWRRRKH